METCDRYVIFVCTSNVCRSPMLEGFAREYFSRHASTSGIRAMSRGLTGDYEPPDSPASENSVLEMQETYDIDISGHRSALLTQKEVDGAEKIICVTAGHASHVRDMFTVEPLDKLTHLPRDIADPWHQARQVYARCASNVQAALLPMLEEFWPQS